MAGRLAHLINEASLDSSVLQRRIAEGLMQRPDGELSERVSGAALYRLGRAMAATVGPLGRILAAGAERGVFAIEDALALARISEPLQGASA